jgi:hypothetical protein
MDTTKQKTHGDYKDTAEISQNLKSVMSTGKNWNALRNTQREALELIVMKVARILSGDQNFRDHWDDIEGYAELGGEYNNMSLPQVKLDIVAAIGGKNG